MGRLSWGRRGSAKGPGILEDVIVFVLRGRVFADGVGSEWFVSDVLVTSRRA